MYHRKARKDHRCSLCFEIVEAKSLYCFEQLTPWSSYDNESFYAYKAHIACDTIFAICRDPYWEYFPLDKQEWRELLEDNQHRWHEVTKAVIKAKSEAIRKRMPVTEERGTDEEYNRVVMQELDEMAPLRMAANKQNIDGERDDY